MCSGEGAGCTMPVESTIESENGFWPFCVMFVCIEAGIHLVEDTLKLLPTGSFIEARSVSMCYTLALVLVIINLQ